MRILALDLSLTNTGAAWFDPCGEAPTVEPPVWDEETMGVWVATIPTGKRRGMDRLAYIRSCVTPYLGRADLLVLEGYSYSSRNRGVELGELGGMVRLMAHDLEVPVAVLTPAQRMKLATGSGRATKEAVLAAAIRRLGYSGTVTDEADALWLLEAAAQTYGLGIAVELPQAHLDALAKVEFPEVSE